MNEQQTRDQVLEKMSASMERQGFLVVGPQGIGKSFMLNRLKNRLIELGNWTIETFDVHVEIDVQSLLALPEKVSALSDLNKCILIDDLDILAHSNIPWIGETISRFLDTAFSHNIRIAGTSRSDPYELGDSFGKALLQLETIYLGPLLPEEAESLVREHTPNASNSVISLTGQASGYVPALIEETLKKVPDATEENATQNDIVDLVKQVRTEDASFDWIEESSLLSADDSNQP